MKQIITWVPVVLSFLVLSTVNVVAEQPLKPMPPGFSLSNAPEDILRNYPLGIINQQDAFAHHGAAIRKEVLPNGNTGWLYKAGEEAGVPSIYLLQFSKDGVVIDVLHKDYKHKIGHSALQYQYLESVEVKLQTLGPGAGKKK